MVTVYGHGQGQSKIYKNLFIKINSRIECTLMLLIKVVKLFILVSPFCL